MVLRYGDEIDPNGDMRAMRAISEMLLPGGFLLLAVPVGRDAVVWNAHRVYGKARLRMLLEGWEVVHVVGLEEGALNGDGGTQPVLVLRHGDGGEAEKASKALLLED